MRDTIQALATTTYGVDNGWMSNPNPRVICRVDFMQVWNAFMRELDYHYSVLLVINNNTTQYQLAIHEAEANIKAEYKKLEKKYNDLLAIVTDPAKPLEPESAHSQIGGH